MKLTDVAPNPLSHVPSASPAIVASDVSRHIDDPTLVRRCLDGDEAAWAALLDKYKRLIYSIPVKYGLAPDAATDVFQEVCVELLAELPRLREPRALPKWLMQVTAHKCTRLKTRARANAGDDALQEMPDRGRLSDELIFDVQREQALRDAVASLPSRCRQLIEMLFFETPARPYREVARSLELSCGSIGFIRGRCLQRLRTQLQKNGFR